MRVGNNLRENRDVVQTKVHSASPKRCSILRQKDHTTHKIKHSAYHISDCIVEESGHRKGEYYYLQSGICIIPT